MSPPRPTVRRAGLPFAALLWSVLHAPIFMALYASSIWQAVRGAPGGFRAWLAPTYFIQAAVLGLFIFLFGLPFSFWPRLYRPLAPALAGLATAAVALDSRVYASVAFHLNGFFFKVLAQPNALKETGVPTSDIYLFAGGAVVWVAIEVAVGGWFLIRFSAPTRRTWAWAVGLLLLGAAERFYSGTLTYFGGQAIFAASGVLPLVAPIRMTGIVEHLLGRRPSDPFSRAGTVAVRLPPSLPPEAIHFTRRPDVILVVAESLPAAHLDERTMPRLWARALGGARFTRHYAGACATSYTLFSLLYGTQAQKLEATVGAGRQALLFPALKANGYQLRILAASCVDWMGLKETVFGQVSGDMQTWCEDSDVHGPDDAMIAGAERWVASADDRPMFLFLFFDGTHFNYYVPPGQETFKPSWDGSGGLRTATVSNEAIANRARNAAHFLDTELDQLLTAIERKRGRPSIVLFTGDHGEEFRQKGHIGHGSAVTSEQIHVPMVVLGDGVRRGVFEEPTSHVDVVPTIFALLGDANAPGLYSDGVSLFDAPPDRFVFSTVGWEPSYAVIGKDLKVSMYAGFTSATITDPEDRPLPDAEARMAPLAGKILRALRGETGPMAVQ